MSSTIEYTAEDLRRDFLSLDVRDYPIHDMWVLIADHANRDDYMAALDVLRRENKGRGLDVTVRSIAGRRYLVALNAR